MLTVNLKLAEKQKSTSKLTVSKFMILLRCGLNLIAPSVYFDLVFLNGIRILGGKKAANPNLGSFELDRANLLY